MISITADFKMSDVEAYIKSETEKFFDDIVQELRRRGKDFVRRARSKSNKDGRVFENQTWDLVTSMGYVLVQNNVIVERYFPSESRGNGEETGKKYAEGEVLNIEHDGDDILLILVAGMNYAAFLDAKNFDVISSSSDEFEAALLQLWQ